MAELFRASLLAFVAASAASAACKTSESKLGQPAQSPPPVTTAPADAATASSLQAELESLRKELDLPAVAAAAWRDGTLLDQAVVGVRKVGDATAAKLTDEWHLGSNTKAMTALLIGIHVDKGLLRWTDTIAQLAPRDLKLDPAFKNVTLDQLLRHEGGFATNEPRPIWKQLWDDGASPKAREAYVRAMLGAPPDHAPGTFTYANANYIIAGYLLEVKTGKRWEELIKSELWNKLGMTSCGFGAPGTKGLVDQPLGHDAGGTPIEPGPAGDNPAGLGPAGTAHCSLADYGKFLNVFATGTPALVTPETMQHLTTARSDTGGMAYAGGWMVVSKSGATILMHSGSNTMWYATAIVQPAKHFAFVVATNKGDQRIETGLEKLLGSFLK